MLTDFTTPLGCSPSIVPEITSSRAARDDRSLSETSLMAFARFGAGIVHAVNNPLATALLSAQVALRSLPPTTDPRAQRCLEYTIQSIEAASQAVRETLQLCCEDNAERRLFDVRDVLRFTSLVMKGVAEAHECKLTWCVCREPSVVFCNPIELEIVLASVVHSAISAGARNIVLSTTVCDNWLTVRIADDATWATSLVDAAAGNVDAVIAGDAPGTHEFRGVVHDVIGANGGTLTHTIAPGGHRTVIVSLPRQHMEPVSHAID